MNLRSRKLLNGTTTGIGITAIALMTLSLLVLLGPIFIRGARAFVFRATVEHRRLMLEQWQRGDPRALERETALAMAERRPVYQALTRFENELSEMDSVRRRDFRRKLKDFKELLRELFGPLPDDEKPVLLRQVYGQTRWDQAQVTLNRLLYADEWDYSDPRRMGIRLLVPRVNGFRRTSLESAFTILKQRLPQMLRPRLTFYWRFLFDESKDSHFFGGIWPEMLGTFYLTLGAMLFAVPLGIIAAVFLAEFAGGGRVISLLRTFISTLAGVPSIVFGLFGLAFFINTIKLSRSKSVLAGATTLALLILPTIIRASEEAIRAVPQTYKEAALSLGVSHLRTMATVILPAALPGILTGIIISMGRAAGETAPIIFTAAVSVGRPLKIWETLSQPTLALPWNIYNLATEHEAVDKIRHVQFGMVLTLVLLVLLLNLLAIWLRARITNKLRV